MTHYNWLLLFVFYIKPDKFQHIRWPSTPIELNLKSYLWKWKEGSIDDVLESNGLCHTIYDWRINCFAWDFSFSLQMEIYDNTWLVSNQWCKTLFRASDSLGIPVENEGVCYFSRLKEERVCLCVGWISFIGLLRAWLLGGGGRCPFKEETHHL